MSAYAEIEIRIPSSCLSVCLSHYFGISTNRQDFTEVLSLSLFFDYYQACFLRVKTLLRNSDEITVDQQKINPTLWLDKSTKALLLQQDMKFAVHGDKKNERNIRYLIVGIQYFFSTIFRMSMSISVLVLKMSDTGLVFDVTMHFKSLRMLNVEFYRDNSENIDNRNII